MSLPHIKNMELEELKEHLKGMNEPTYRAKQIYKWLHEGVTSFAEMTNVSHTLAKKLEESLELTVPHLEQRQISKLDGTEKFLWRLADGNLIESVFMQYKHGNTACISTQVGCRMGCVFCASAANGLVRNLQASEMLDQVLFMQKETGKRISRVVLMGMGEPLDNYEETVRFLRLITHEAGLNIGQRRISISTCGLAEQIEQLADENLQVTLSISLHCPDDSSRDKIMPINKKYPIKRLMEACRIYFKKTGRRVSYEYTMIGGISDKKEQAEELSRLLRGQPAHVNLIPLNPIEGNKLLASNHTTMQAFANILEENGITATIRRRLGSDIEAACGQLRNRNIKNGKEGTQ